MPAPQAAPSYRMLQQIVTPRNGRRLRQESHDLSPAPFSQPSPSLLSPQMFMAQESCIEFCEAALKTQESVVTSLPAVLEKERQATQVARQRAKKASERADALQADIDERERLDRNQAHALELAQRRGEELEDRLQHLDTALAKLAAESVQRAQRLSSKLRASRRTEAEAG